MSEELKHPDDVAVDRFALAMKRKLKWEREERGRSGWDNPEVCSDEHLANLLMEHLEKGNSGNFEDVANFCMMLHQRGAHPRVLASIAAWNRRAPSPDMREAVKALILAGNDLANCAYNLSQEERLTNADRRTLRLSQVAWDDARRSLTGAKP